MFTQMECRLFRSCFAIDLTSVHTTSNSAGGGASRLTRVRTANSNFGFMDTPAFLIARPLGVLVELDLIKTRTSGSRVFQTSRFQTSPYKRCASQVRACEVCASQVRAAEYCMCEIRIRQFSVPDP